MSTPTYVQHTWATYEMITRDHLNNMENGIAANNAGLRTLETWQSKAANAQAGSVTLTNSLEFPFNNSVQSVALATARDNTNYIVQILAVSAVGNPGVIEVTDRQVNGFKLGFTGSASSATITYTVIGGFD